MFKLAPNGSGGYTESVYYSFSGGSYGQGPQGSVIMDSAGNLFGTTAANNGNVFEVYPH